MERIYIAIYIYSVTLQGSNNLRGNSQANILDRCTQENMSDNSAKDGKEEGNNTSHGTICGTKVFRGDNEGQQRPDGGSKHGIAHTFFKIRRMC